jgi:1-acyl-sn-glycerol-3-phosphate acyltransferase
MTTTGPAAEEAAGSDGSHRPEPTVIGSDGAASTAPDGITPTRPVTDPGPLPPTDPAPSTATTDPDAIGAGPIGTAPPAPGPIRPRVTGAVGAGTLTTLRRIVTVPVVVAVELLILAMAPLALLVAAVVGVAMGSSRPVRSVALVAAYAAVELSLVARALRGIDDWDALVPEVLGRAYSILRTVLDVRVVLEDGSATREQVHTGHPLVVLARHCGPGDSLFIAWLLAVHYRLRLSVVLKSALRWEPVVDLAGDHLPLCFVHRHERGARDRVGDLAASMARGDALLLFPEGANFSWPRWRRAVAALAASGAHRAARLAGRHTHTLPPRRGGAGAALLGAPTADVLLLTHSGFAPDGRDRPWWRLPVHRTLLVRTTVVPSAGVPRDEATLTSWLEATWAQVDTWVARHAQMP